MEVDEIKTLRGLEIIGTKIGNRIDTGNGMRRCQIRWQH